MLPFDLSPSNHAFLQAAAETVALRPFHPVMLGNLTHHFVCTVGNIRAFSQEKQQHRARTGLPTLTYGLFQDPL